MSHNPFSLEGRAALVTGGAGVLGFAIARALGEVGARVAITSRTLDRAEQRAAQLREQGIDAIGLALEATHRESVEECAANAAGKLGPLHVLVAAAGGNRPDATATPERPFFDLPAEALSDVVEQNLLGGALLPIQVIGRTLAERGEGSIITITSVSAQLPLTRVIGYGAAKAAVANATQWLAVYFAKELKTRVRVNALMPGFFLTEQNRFLLTQPDGSLTPRGKTITDNTPMGRFGEAHELGGACVFLASDASTFVTGSTVVVDGGFTAFSGV